MVVKNVRYENADKGAASRRKILTREKSQKSGTDLQQRSQTRVQMDCLSRKPGMMIRMLRTGFVGLVCRTRM